MQYIATAVGLILATVIVATAQAIFALLFAFPLEWAWNESVATLGGPRITWFASFALLVVTSILGSYFNQKKSTANE